MGKVYKNKVVLITGASRGIGKYLVNYFLREGAIVFGVSRGEAKNNHKSYIHFIADVSKHKEVANVIFKIRKNGGKLDVVINNAGIASMNTVMLTPDYTVKNIFEINYLGTFNVSRESVKLMIGNGTGRIVNISSVAVPMQIEGEAIYASSKAAIECFTKIFAKEIAAYGITVNTIGPSPINTSLITNVPKENVDKIIDSMPIKRLGEFEDVLNVVKFFCSEGSNYITGQTIYLGGVS
jgi:3-oxoacyl-[acyl-carrier protein] reductase